MDLPVVEPVAEDAFVIHLEDGPKPVRVPGHRLYVRKRRRHDEFEGGPILRPDWAKEDTVLCDVLAVGPEVGKWRKNPPRDADGNRLPRIVDRVTLGSLVAFPAYHPDKKVICRSPYCRYDFFIDAGVAEFEVIEDERNSE